MSQNFCPNCGSVMLEEARFCRHCGAPLLRGTGEGLGGPTVSPLAATVPLPAPESTAPENFDHGGAPRNTLDQDEADRRAFDLDARLAEGQPFLADEYGHVVTPDNDPDLEEFLKSPDFVRPIGDDKDDASEETIVTVPVRRSSDARPAAGSAASAPPAQQPVRVVPSAPSSVPPVSPAVSPVAERRALRVWLGAALIVLLVLGVGAGGFAAWYFTRALPRPPAVAESRAEISSTGIPASDPKQQAQEKLAEAEQLSAAGDAEAALARLREALALDATNAEAYRRLADLLLARGDRRAAIDALREATKLDPNDHAAWRQLAVAQFAEGLYAEAAGSYQELFAVSPGEARAADAATQLSYADALRFSGRQLEARALYQRLAASADAGVARLSRQRLAQLGPAGAVANDNRADRARRENERAGNESAVAPPPPVVAPAPATITTPRPQPVETPRPQTLSPGEHYQRGASLWAANRAAALAEFRAAAGGGNADAYYYLGLSMAEGRDPKDLKRAELVAALEYFQRARAGRFSAQARDYEDRLGREYDKRRKQ